MAFFPLCIPISFKYHHIQKPISHIVFFSHIHILIFETKQSHCTKTIQYVIKYKVKHSKNLLLLLVLEMESLVTAGTRNTTGAP